MTAAQAAPLSARPTLQNYARLPLSFERNQGQADPRVQFIARGRESALFLTPTEAVFALVDKKPTPASGREPNGGDPRKPTPPSRTALRMQLVGADPGAKATAEQPLAGRVNYFIGRDPRQWHADVPTFGRAGFHGVYPGVDLVYYGSQQRLEYDFVVAPHADPAQIKLRFAGADRVWVDRQGDLIVGMHGRILTWRKPSVYQEGKGGKQAVSGRFRMKSLPDGQSQVSFALGNYDARRPLVIDPILTYSTLIGGTSNGEVANGIAVDRDGNAYITGNTASIDYPTTSGSAQPVSKSPLNGGEVVITKFNAAGTALVYSTFLGGSDQEMATGIAVDASGAAYVTGLTKSRDFPVTPGAFQAANKGTSWTVFVTKLNAAGSALAYSTYLGGSSGNPFNGGEWGEAIAVDSGGNAYVAGWTESLDFPVTPGAFQTTGKIGVDAFVTKLNPTGTGLVYSTFLGGTGNDYGYAIAVDGSGAAYVGGQTASADFPVTPGAFQKTKGAGTFTANSFVTKIDPAGAFLVYSTYLRESNEGSAHAITVDNGGNAYVVGFSTSTDFPITPGAFQTTNRALGGNKCAYVTKLNPTGSAPVYSTFLGGNNYSTITGIAVDSSGKASVVGYTGAADFPTTIGAFQRAMGGGPGTGNVFVTKFDAAGTALIYSTFIAANSTSVGNGIALDSNGDAYVTGYTFSTNFPVTPGAFQATNRSDNSSTVFVTKLSTNPIFPDFNNNGHTDLLIQNPRTGGIASWFMQGAQWTGGAFFSLTPPTEYALVGAGDFSGNGATTLVLQSLKDNRLVFWYTGGVNNATIIGGDFISVIPQAGWKVVGVGDFNGDGKSDLVFQNQTTNQVAIWFMNGAAFQGGVLMPFTPPAGWKAVGAGDFNGDGFSDLAFQNQSTRQIALWYMNGPTYVDGTILTTLPAAGWKVTGVGDYNGDGYADLLFQHQTTNQGAVWYLKGNAFLGGDLISLTPPAGWHIVGPR
ncbi:MAG: hypothetical protein JWL77_1434 [Chthonomonadaceae bacterium]|nr:hypothetical protein [Chthonomonadaceae bacterium]